MFGVLYVPQLIARRYLEIMFAMGIHGRQRFFTGNTCNLWDLRTLSALTGPEHKEYTQHNM